MMSRLYSLRLASLIGLLGSGLVIIGFFLPARFVTVIFHLQPPLYSTDSFWSMLVNTVTGGTIHDLSSEMAIGSFLLSILVPLLTFLTGLFGKRKRAIFILSLIFATLGLLEFLASSLLLLSFSFPHTGTEIHTSGPGFWLMLIGFPICIGSSIAHIVLFTPHGANFQSNAGLPGPV
ncbi:hypothetical protein Krac_9980 [Ktedonobacter racemifer DSM 44963]|uniref:Uncharacterized protein n=1 Tax=Ktedonobacter racemifer DSM 44963 TaxID=485913 RepID=D6TEQ7_KTERA|nr:hypothetical protein Krac_9980 [Ktedonobacter racemifer DSM 44963]